MATIVSPSPLLHTPPRLLPLPNLTFHCSFTGRTDRNPTPGTPPLLRAAVSVATELLRLGRHGSPPPRLPVEEDEVVRCVDDVVDVLRGDYDRAYFLTGNFSLGIYTEDCLFEDPTISFRGRDLYSRNLKLLVPFFDHPSLVLKTIEKGRNLGVEFVQTSWKLRTYLKLPWRPLITISGMTIYDLNSDLKITRHSESWDASALEAVGQIFTPSKKDNV